jgi:hypothetical protein
MIGQLMPQNRVRKTSRTRSLRESEVMPKR